MTNRNGARFEVRLDRQATGRAEYTARFEWQDQAAELPVTVDGNGSGSAPCSVTWPMDQVAHIPDWIVKYATVALRGAARASAEEGWPRRLTRWRACPADTPKPTPRAQTDDD